MKLLWSPTALAHLRQAKAYIAEENPQAAAETAARILEAIERLQEFPASGRPGLLPHTRELIVPGTPLFLPYRVIGETIEILGVIHGARKWPES